MSLSQPESSHLDTSVLVTTFRRPRHLALVLESIALQRGVPRDYEVIVADDGSDDATPEVVAQVAATVAALVGEDFRAAFPAAAEPIAEVVRGAVRP